MDRSPSARSPRNGSSSTSTRAPAAPVSPLARSGTPFPARAAVRRSPVPSATTQRTWRRSAGSWRASRHSRSWSSWSSRSATTSRIRSSPTPSAGSAEHWRCRRSSSAGVSSTGGSRCSSRAARSRRSSTRCSRRTRTRRRCWRRLKLVTFDDGKTGRVEGEEVVELAVGSMREYFERGGADEAGPRHALSAVRLSAPIVPRKFFHTAGNFREHEEESKRVGWTHEIAPWIVFFQNVDAIVGPDEPVVYPEHLTQELDYELELAVVIRKAGKWFGPEEAMDYVGGYVIFNDITARDIQRREMRSGVFSFCKAIDTFCPLGPWIVNPDEIPDPQDLAMELRVNGEPRQSSHSGNMSVTIPEILSHYSALGYSAGDVVSTGTVSGVAGFSEDAASLYLRPGDVIEAEIERIGVLRNPVISWQEAHGKPLPERVHW